MTHLTNGAIAVVGHALNNERNSVNAIAFVGQLFIIFCIIVAGPARYRFFDSVAFHVFTQRFINSSAQARVICRIRTTFGRNRQLSNNLGEYFAALGVLAPLAVPDISPFAVTSHGYPPLL